MNKRKIIWICIVIVVIALIVVVNISQNNNSISNTSNLNAASTTEISTQTNSSAQSQPAPVVNTPQTSDVVSSSPTQQATTSSITYLSVKEADVNYNNYINSGGVYSQQKEVTVRGVLFNMLPSSYAPAAWNIGNEIMIEDEQDSSYLLLIMNVDPSIYNNLNLGDILEVKGTLAGGSGDRRHGFNLEGAPVVVGHSNSIPSPSVVLSQAQVVIDQNQQNISNAIQNVNNTTSIGQCLQINDTMINQLCTNMNINCFDNALPYVYKDSNTLINNALMSLLNACTPRFIK